MEKMESIVGGVGIGETDAVVTSVRWNPRESEKLGVGEVAGGREEGRGRGRREALHEK